MFSPSLRSPRPVLQLAIVLWHLSIQHDTSFSKTPFLFLTASSMISSFPLLCIVTWNSNNASRTESAKDSRVIDRRIKSAWSLHPHQVVIGNETDFAGKLAKATDVVLVGAHKFFSEASKETGDIEEGG